MAVDDRPNVGACAIDLGVNEPLQIYTASLGIECGAVQVEGNDVFAPYESRRHIAREQEAAERLVVPRADMTEAVDDALPVQNAIGDDQLVDKLGIGHKLRQVDLVVTDAVLARYEYH